MAEYWTARRRSNPPPLSATMLRLLHEQHGRARRAERSCCTPTRSRTTHREWERWLKVIRKAMTKQYITADPDPARTYLLMGG